MTIVIPWLTHFHMMLDIFSSNIWIRRLSQSENLPHQNTKTPNIGFFCKRPRVRILNICKLCRKWWIRKNGKTYDRIIKKFQRPPANVFWIWIFLNMVILNMSKLISVFIGWPIGSQYFTMKTCLWREVTINHNIACFDVAVDNSIWM